MPVVIYFYIIQTYKNLSFKYLYIKQNLYLKKNNYNIIVIKLILKLVTKTQNFKITNYEILKYYILFNILLLINYF